MIICAMSDLHGHMPPVPECDLLIVAGDICPDLFGGVRAKKDPLRQTMWFEDVWLRYISKQPAKRVLVTWGNHDFCGEHMLPRKRVSYGHVDVIVDDLIEVEGKKIWLTPWSNQFMDWAFMKEHDQLGETYAQIPDGVDILVSHQPPAGCGDLYTEWPSRMPRRIGSEELRYHVERVKPKIVVCGHLHKGYGTYEVVDSKIYNVSVVNERYELVNPPTVIEVD